MSSGPQDQEASKEVADTNERSGLAGWNLQGETRRPIPVSTDVVGTQSKALMASHADHRLARAVAGVLRSPSDPRTITGWARAVGASPSAVRAWCRAAGVRLLTSHNLALIDDLCATVTVVDRGSLVYDGSVEALKARADAASADRLEDGLIALLGRGSQSEPLSWLAKDTER